MSRRPITVVGGLRRQVPENVWVEAVDSRIIQDTVWVFVDLTRMIAVTCQTPEDALAIAQSWPEFTPARHTEVFNGVRIHGTYPQRQAAYCVIERAQAAVQSAAG